MTSLTVKMAMREVSKGSIDFLTILSENTWDLIIKRFNLLKTVTWRSTI